MNNTLGEKLAVFIEFKSPQDDSERLVDKYQRKDNLICHSAAGEGSSVFIKFLTRRIILKKEDKYELDKAKKK
jgi:hypothetical protein